MKTKKPTKEELEQMADVLLGPEKESEDIFDRCKRVSYDGVEIDHPCEGIKSSIIFFSNEK